MPLVVLGLEVIEQSREQLAWIYAQRTAKPVELNYINASLARLHAGDHRLLSPVPLCELALGKPRLSARTDQALAKSVVERRMCGLCHPPRIVAAGSLDEKSSSG